MVLQRHFGAVSWKILMTSFTIWYLIPQEIGSHWILLARKGHAMIVVLWNVWHLHRLWVLWIRARVRSFASVWFLLPVMILSSGLKEWCKMMEGKAFWTIQRKRIAKCNIKLRVESPEDSKRWAGTVGYGDDRRAGMNVQVRSVDSSTGHGHPLRSAKWGSDNMSEVVSREIRCSHLKISFCLCLPTATSPFPELGVLGFVFKSLESWQGYNHNSDEFWLHISPINFKQIKLLGTLLLIPTKNTTPAPTL